MRAADHAPEDILKAAEEHAMVAHHVLMGHSEAAGRAMRARTSSPVTSAGSRAQAKGCTSRNSLEAQ
jgi:hypothetical protein